MIDIYSVEDDLEIGVIYIDSITHTRTACLYQRKVSWVMKFSDERLHPEVHLGHMRAKSEDRLIPKIRRPAQTCLPSTFQVFCLASPNLIPFSVVV